MRIACGSARANTRRRSRMRTHGARTRDARKENVRVRERGSGRGRARAQAPHRSTRPTRPARVRRRWEASACERTGGDGGRAHASAEVAALRLQVAAASPDAWRGCDCEHGARRDANRSGCARGRRAACVPSRKRKVVEAHARGLEVDETGSHLDSPSGSSRTGPQPTRAQPAKHFAIRRDVIQRSLAAATVQGKAAQAGERAGLEDMGRKAGSECDHDH